jgi:hypothetical protein
MIHCVRVYLYHVAISAMLAWEGGPLLQQLLTVSGSSSSSSSLLTPTVRDKALL